MSASPTPPAGTKLGTYGPDPRPVSERTPRPAGGLALIGTVAVALTGAVCAALLALGAPGTMDDRYPRTLPPCAQDVAQGPIPCTLPDGRALHVAP